MKSILDNPEFQKVSDKPMITRIEIENPYVIILRGDDGQIQTRLCPDKQTTYRSYGLMIADLIRHTARCFNVAPEQVVEWINKELVSPTTPIEGGRVQ
jgi:hypothetical protein